jgi:hypothetical protein
MAVLDTAIHDFDAHRIASHRSPVQTHIRPEKSAIENDPHMEHVVKETKKET